MQALSQRGIPHTVIHYAQGVFSCDAWPSGQVFAYGSHGLSRLAQAKGWTPGSYLEEEDDQRHWNAHWGPMMLNHGAQTLAFRDITVPSDGRFFLRPAADTKMFSGMVLDGDEIQGWQHSLARGEMSPIHCSADFGLNTLVTFGPSRTIMKECRFFIVQGQPVAWSVYRINGASVLSRDVGENALAFVHKALAVANPFPAFVMDVALTPDGYRIVELNCINTSGMYRADPELLVDAIEALGRNG